MPTHHTLHIKHLREPHFLKEIKKEPHILKEIKKEPHFLREIQKEVRKDVSIKNFKDKLEKPTFKLFISKIIKPTENTLTKSIEPTIKNIVHKTTNTLDKELNKPIKDIVDNKNMKTLNHWIAKKIEKPLNKDFHTLGTEIKKEDKLINKDIKLEVHTFSKVIPIVSEKLPFRKARQNTPNPRHIGPTQPTNTAIAVSSNPVLQENKPIIISFPFFL